ncbi:MAG: hypothetical protein CL955_00230 [Erythrobacteraceae bacterium]|nr:hypothetical protein [Erythrobacteraceae bacterium]
MHNASHAPALPVFLLLSGCVNRQAMRKVANPQHIGHMGGNGTLRAQGRLFDPRTVFHVFHPVGFDTRKLDLRR